MHCVESLGDYVGVESCFDWVGPDTESGMSHRVGRGSDDDDGKRREMQKSREYPPPIPWLARTANSPVSRMPWVLKRFSTEDGRLIITGHKADRHEYFEAHRSDGRLRLLLVPIDVLPAGESFDEVTEEMHGGDRHGDVAVSDGGCDDRNAAALEDRSALANGGTLITDACGGGNKCSNSFIFGVAVTAMPPLHT